MKKIISLSLIFILICAFGSISFAEVGDIKGYATYTDICAYINHYPITSYNVNDCTVVVAEDLRNYGFDVEWNPDNRSLGIKRNSATVITPYGTVYKYASKAGQTSMPFLETDIKAYVNGIEVSSYNIGGNTVVNIEDLRPYGEVVWLPETRTVKMWIEGLPITDYKPLEDVEEVARKEEARKIAAESFVIAGLKSYRSSMKDPTSFKLYSVYAGYKTLYPGYDFIIIASVGGKNSWGGVSRNNVCIAIDINNGYVINDFIYYMKQKYRASGTSAERLKYLEYEGAGLEIIGYPKGLTYYDASYIFDEVVKG